MAENINYAEFKKNVIGKRQTCIIKFYSDTCHLCINLAPLYDNISKKYAGQITFYKADTLKDEELADNFKMDGVPTIYFFHRGRYGEIPYPYDDPDALTGYRESDIVNYIEERIKNA